MGLADDIMRKVEAGAMDGLEAVAQEVLKAAQANVPVGDPAYDPDPEVSLAASGHIERHENGFVVIFDTPYAAFQHENQRLDHPRGGGSKFLERAVTEIVPTVDKVVASRVEARLASGLLSSDPARPHR
jgi:hypothetical protein